jgi:hypothetical protein
MLLASMGCLALFKFLMSIIACSQLKEASAIWHRKERSGYEKPNFPYALASTQK